MDLQTIITDFFLPASYVLFGLTMLALIVLPVIKAFDDPQSLIKSAIGLGFIALLFVVGYVLSGDEVTAKFETFGITPAQSKIIGGSLIMMYVLGVITVGALIYSEIVKFFK